LQAWQDEIPNLPFQPDEEQVLENIINNAQEFRTHISPFCNPVLATADESETQRFYLRKIEGAEILLAYETNFFRQELHKWSPVADRAPPVLEVSKSTRKPRPTKLQKLMAQHGVNDPEALPQSLRTKAHNFKRKSSEPSSATRPQPLQPAPGRSTSGTPTSHTFPPSSSASMNHQGPVLSGISSGHDHAHPSPYFHSDHHYIANTQAPSPAFAPHAYLHGGSMQAASYGSTSPHRPGIFNEAGFGRIDSAASLNSPMREGFHLGPGSSQGPLGVHGSQDVDRMFNDLTNTGEEDGATGKHMPIERKEEDKERDTRWEEDIDINFDGP